MTATAAQKKEQQVGLKVRYPRPAIRLWTKKYVANVWIVECAELSEEDQQQMAAGTIAVREALGPDVLGVTDREIHEALWHYYYDVGHTVTYILDTRMKKAGGAKKEKKKKKGGLAVSLSFVGMGEWGSGWELGAGGLGQRGLGGGLCVMIEEQRWLMFALEPRSRNIAHFMACSDPFIPADFWNDMRWLHIPSERQTIFLEPLYPHGGLLGGSPDAVPKMSKLQALAAARKKKAQEQKSSASMDVVETPMKELAISQPPENVNRGTPSEVFGSAARNSLRTYPVRKRKNSSPHRKTSQPSDPVEQKASQPVEDKISVPSVEQAKPSAFASTMFGISGPAPIHSPPKALFTLPYSANPSAHSTDAFAGPSPDDVVLAAQSKGSAHSAKASK
jgi:elongation factor 1 alpha-like protein